ncbi:MAG: exodeoxyribonuclease VII large subunit, partial [Clostridia bacterium]
MKGHVFTVGEVNLYLKAMMESDSALKDIYVRGEISNYKFHSSGHHYMTLKDENGTLRAVMFKFDAKNLKFRP